MTSQEINNSLIYSESYTKSRTTISLSITNYCAYKWRRNRANHENECWNSPPFWPTLLIKHSNLLTHSKPS